jgi:hypothetical protein
MDHCPVPKYKPSERKQSATGFRQFQGREDNHRFNNMRKRGVNSLKSVARETKIPSPSLQRMFGPSGNPSAQNLFGVIAALQRTEGVSIKLQMHAS